MNKEPKTLPQAIKIVVDKYGKDIVNNARMVNIMSDLIDLDESLATKKILKELLKLGYGKKIQETSTHDLVDLKLQFYINEIVNTLGYDESISRYVLNSINYGLGSTSSIPRYFPASLKTVTSFPLEKISSSKKTTDYSQYSYRKLLDFLSLEDRYDSEKKDYASYLISMSKANSIDEMIVIYNDIFKKTAYYIFARNLPNIWFITNTWASNKYLLYELNKCLNENILRWYKDLTHRTNEQLLSCVLNLRESDSMLHIQQQFLNNNSNDVSDLEDMIDLRDYSYKLRKEIRMISNVDEYYFECKNDYVDTMGKLLYYGYKKTVEEEKFEEIRHIKYEKSSPEDDLPSIKDKLAKFIGTIIGIVVAGIIITSPVLGIMCLLNDHPIIGILLLLVGFFGYLITFNLMQKYGTS